MENKDKSELPIIQQHTPEPWEIRGIESTLISNDKDAFICSFYNKRGEHLVNSNANAARIVDCVNVLAGIDDPKKWVEEMKQRQERTVSALYAYKQVQELQAENERLKKALTDLSIIDTVDKTHLLTVEMTREIAKQALKGE
jgi:hypothetical protein